MKILQLSHYYAPHLGGVEKHLAKLNQELLKAGHQVTVLTSQHSTELPLEEEIDGVEVKRLPIKSEKYVGLFKIWQQLLRQIKFFRQFDLIQIHDVFIWFLPLRILLPFKPFFMTFHGYQSSPVKFKEKFLVQLAHFLCQGSLCVGEFIPKHFNLAQTEVTYGAVDLKRYQELAKKYQTPQPQYDALYVGRFDPQVGFEIYLGGINSLQQESEFKVAFLGNGHGRGKAEAVGECLGWVNDVVPYYFQTKFAFVSRYLSILEAMAAQKLVFAVYESGDQVKEDYLKLAPFAQWLVIVDGPRALVEQVHYYQTHPAEADKKTRAAYRWVQDQTWSKLAETYQQLWQSAV